MTLLPQQRIRYSRQRMLPSIGDDGQARICRAHVAAYVASHEASTTALTYLVAAGIGELSLITPVEDADALSLAAALRDMRPDAKVSLAAVAPAHASLLPPLSERTDMALWQVGVLLTTLASAR